VEVETMTKTTTNPDGTVAIETVAGDMEAGLAAAPWAAREWVAAQAEAAMTGRALIEARRRLRAALSGL